MRHFKGRYDKWTKERIKHLPLLEVTRYIRCMMTPDQRFSGDPDAEITNLGVVNNKMRMV